MTSSLVVQSDDNWLTANDALSILEKPLGGAVFAKATIADLLKDGKLQAQARAMYRSRAMSLNVAWRERDKADAEYDVLVDREVWERSRFWRDDIDLWRWPKNHFVVTESKRPVNRTILIGVRFDKDQIDSFLTPTARPHSGGRPIRAEDWAKIGIALIQMAKAGAFGPCAPQADSTPARYLNVSKFVDALLLQTDNAYSRSHAHELLGPVYQHFVQKDAEGITGQSNIGVSELSDKPDAFSA